MARGRLETDFFETANISSSEELKELRDRLLQLQSPYLQVRLLGKLGNDRLMSLIKSNNDLKLMFTYLLSSALHDALFKSLNTKGIHPLFNSKEAFLIIIHSNMQDFSNFDALIASLDNEILSTLISSDSPPEDLSAFLLKLPLLTLSNSALKLFNALSDTTWLSLIRFDSSKVFNSDVCSFLQKQLFERLKDKGIHSLFNSNANLQVILHSRVSAEQLSEVVEQLDNEVLCTAISSGSSPSDITHFLFILTQLTPSSATKLLKALGKDVLMSLITDYGRLVINFRESYQSLIKERIAAVLESLISPGDLAPYSSLCYTEYGTTVLKCLLNNKDLDASSQRAFYGSEGPYQHYSLCWKDSSTLQHERKSIVHLAEFRWQRALLKEEGERLQKDEKTKELGTKAIDLYRQLKVEGNDTKALLLKAMKDFERTPLEKLLHFIADCFNALLVVLKVKEGSHRFFRPRVDDYVTSMSNAHTLAEPNQIQSRAL